MVIACGPGARHATFRADSATPAHHRCGSGQRDPSRGRRSRARCLAASLAPRLGQSEHGGVGSGDDQRVEADHVVVLPPDPRLARDRGRRQHAQQISFHDSHASSIGSSACSCDRSALVTGRSYSGPSASDAAGTSPSSWPPPLMTSRPPDWSRATAWHSSPHFAQISTARPTRSLATAASIRCLGLRHADLPGLHVLFAQRDRVEVPLDPETGRGAAVSDKAQVMPAAPRSCIPWTKPCRLQLRGTPGSTASR